MFLFVIDRQKWHNKITAYEIGLATNNPNKLKEVREILSDSVQIVSLEDLNCFEEIAETETTLEGNAKLKANYITQNYGYRLELADDTGLEVEALNGKPVFFCKICRKIRM